MMENGIYPDISHKEYHSMIDRISNSYLSRLAKCPAAAKVPVEETPAMTFGRALHSFILDGPVAFGSDVCVLPEINRRTNAGKALYEQIQKENDGKAIITEEDLQSIIEMDRSVKAHPVAKQLIGNGTTEVSVFWDDPFSGLQCKARPDLIPGAIRNTLIDLKSTRDASLHGFQRSVTGFGYHRQAAFYLDGMTKASGDVYDLFAFIAVETYEPYRTEVYTLSPTFIERGRTDYQMLITIENKCRHAGEWPNYQSATVTELEMPRYMAYQEEG